MKYVAYYRVSTARQGMSGLGLEAQQLAVKQYAGEVAQAFTEVESGKRSDRPELAKAIAACKRLKATLVIAKLDRLARNVHFVSGLMKSEVNFVSCDNPHATPLTIHILAAVAEDEARRISERTKAALAAAKRRGAKLGNPTNLTTVAARKGTRANVAAAKRYNEQPREAAAKLRDKGYTLSEIANNLTGQGLLTRRGGAWSATGVMRLLA